MFDSIKSVASDPAFVSGTRVLTIAEPAVRSRLNTAVEWSVKPVHVESVSDAISVARTSAIHVVLLSPTAIDVSSRLEVAKLRSACSGSVLVAVLQGWTPNLADCLLALGGYGIREAVDVSSREGLGRLRSILGNTEWDLTGRLMTAMRPILSEASEAVNTFFDHLIRSAPTVVSMKELASQLQVLPSSLTSRFWRARLPSPKQYLVETRLLYASALLEVPGTSLAQAGYQLHFSSPQSFYRHVSEQLHMSGNEFRQTVSFAKMLDQYLDRLFVRHRKTLKWFEPLGSTNSWDAIRP